MIIDEDQRDRTIRKSKTVYQLILYCVHSITVWASGLYQAHGRVSMCDESCILLLFLPSFSLTVFVPRHDSDGARPEQINVKYITYFK